MEHDHFPLRVLQLEADVFLTARSRVEDNVVDAEVVTNRQVFYEETGLGPRLHIDDVSLLAEH